MPETVVVIPCYNEASRLRVDCFHRFTLANPAVRLLFVNDGSQDDTQQMLADLSRRASGGCAVVDLAHNVGKAEAVRQGFLEAFQCQPRFVGFWDADLATPLEAIPRFCDVLREQHVQVVIGSRVALLGRRIERTAKRHLLGRVFATAASLALGLTVYDTQCGAKMFRRSAAIERLFGKPFHSRWIFDVELFARMLVEHRAGQLPPVEDIIYELPLDYWQDVHGSKLRGRDFVTAAYELARIFASYRLANGRAGRAPATQWEDEPACESLHELNTGRDDRRSAA